MKCIECIKVQAANLSETTLHHICDATRQMIEIPGFVALEVYRHSVISGNIALLLLWELDPPQAQGSMVGLQLASELKRFGLVAHSVWISKQQ